MTLSELEEAVAKFHGSSGTEAAVGIADMVDFVEYHIAREKLLDEKLTSEWCERLGMGKTQCPGEYMFCDSRYTIDAQRQVIINGDAAFAWGSNSKPLKILHLLAAAVLAGEEVRGAVEGKVEEWVGKGEE